MGVARDALWLLGDLKMLTFDDFHLFLRLKSTDDAENHALLRALLGTLLVAREP
jgi:hypothetical protein